MNALRGVLLNLKIKNPDKVHNKMAKLTFALNNTAIEQNTHKPVNLYDSHNVLVTGMKNTNKVFKKLIHLKNYKESLLNSISFC